MLGYRVQVANFWITGLLVVAGAVGIRRALRPSRARPWGPLEDLDGHHCLFSKHPRDVSPDE